MTISIPELWRLVIESQLLPPEECQRLGQQFGHVKGAAAQGNARTLAEWLISQNVISRYQATILLAGRAGPFAYGDYKIYDRVEGGPLAGQFKAVHATTGHPVLLKFFAGQTVSDPQRWAATAERSAKHTGLNHPHWWRSFELEDLDQFKFLAVADIQGQSCLQRLATGQRIPHQEGCKLAYQIALALARAHETGFTHGDIRPANVMVDRQGRGVLWCDPATPLVGISTTAADDATLARADYAAPELAAGGTPDALSDVYALGCTLYHMLAGAPPFSGGDIQQKMQRHASEAIQPLAPYGVPERLEKTVAYMMAKNTSVRFQSASQAADQLGQFLPSAERQPQVAPASVTLAALEQHLRQKPKRAPVRPEVRPVSPVATPTTNGPATGRIGNAPTPVGAAGAGPAGVGLAGAGTMPTVGAAPSEGGTSTAHSRAPTSGSSLPQQGVSVGAAPVVAATGAAFAGPSASERLKKKKPITRNTPLLIMIGCGIAFLATLGILTASGVFSGGEATEVAQDDADDSSASDATAENDGPDEDKDATDGDDDTADGDDGSRYLVVAEDDGETLWAPPTDGEPVDLTYVPSGGKVYVVARPSAILNSSEGDSLLKALGPEFQAARAEWERAAGVTLDEVDKLVVGIYPNNSLMPRFSYTVTLKSPADMKARWGNPSPAGGEGRYNVGGRRAWLPASADGRVFVLGAAEEVDPLAASPAPQPRPQLDGYFSQLVKSTDRQQHFVAIFDPIFFQTDGRKLFRGPYEKLLEPLEWFFGDDTKALVSMHFSDDFYAEMRLYARLQMTPAEMRQTFEQRIEQLPKKLKRYLLALNPPPYWKELWFNFPDMISLVESQTRSGIEGDEAIFNFVLPGHTAPNLIAASELSVASTPGATYDPGATGGTPTAEAAPQTLDEVLAAKVDLGFPQQSLEFSMRDLVTAFKDEYPNSPVDFRIKILGGDLQKEGITRNQQIRDFDARATPVRDILTQLVSKANPVTTVTDPSQADQKLVWVVGADPDDASQKIVLITTRSAAEERNLSLPAVFQPQ